LTYRSDIDGLRAVAVLLVIMFHIGMPWVTGGFVGVDVFFVVSGFLITSIIKGDIQDGNFSLLRFYDRRIRRIFPALIAVYLFCVLVSAVLLLPSDLASFGLSLVASAAFMSNFLFSLKDSYFGAASIDEPLLHTWSLSVEEQFYIFWPLILVAAFRFWNARGFFWLMVAGILGSLAFAEWELGSDGAAAFYLMPARAWELGLGGLLAFKLPVLERRPRLRDLLSLAGLALILWSAFALTNFSDFPGLGAVPACLGTTLLILSGAKGQGLCNRLLSLRPVVFVGLISYSLYLWHWPLIVFLRYYLDREFHHFEAVAVVAASFAVAAVSYRFIEAPFRRSARQSQPAEVPAGRPAKRTVGLGLVAAMTCAFLGACMKIDGWAWRLPEAAVAVDTISAQFNPFRKSCYGLSRFEADSDDCTIGQPRADGGYDVLVVGDSHADHFVPGFDNLLKARGLAGRQLTTSSCPPLYGTRLFSRPDRELCEDFVPAIRRFLDAHDEVRLVVLAARWALYSETTWLRAEPFRRKFLVDEQGKIFTRENSRRVMKKALKKTVEAMTSRGLRVVLMAQVPPLSTRRTRCVARARWHGSEEALCYEPAATARRRTRFATELIAEIAVADDRVDAFIPAEVICDEALCVPVLDDIFLFRDEDHLNATGSERLLSRFRLPALSQEGRAIR
jgi:peptidoglycan/LPS O-acetylase OafA/YrhL